MRQNLVPISIAIAFALGCAATSVFKIPLAHAQSPARWEYLCIPAAHAKYEDLEKMLNEAGAEGWELQAESPHTAYPSFCLKRPARSGAPRAP
jgi:hypothetical protein